MVCQEFCAFATAIMQNNNLIEGIQEQELLRLLGKQKSTVTNGNSSRQGCIYTKRRMSDNKFGVRRFFLFQPVTKN